VDAFTENLNKLAELAIRVGLNLEEGQEIMATAPIEAVDFVRLLAEKAYENGASLFTVLYGDNLIARKRLALVPEAHLDKAPAWLYEGMAKAFHEGAARLAVSGNDPKALEGLPPERVGRAQQAQSRAYRPALSAITEFVTNWTIVPFAHPGWAKAVLSSPASRRRRRCRGSGRPSSRPPGWTRRTPWPPGRPTTAPCTRRWPS
jgi:aminopeptidase